jgi:hypothetical protein
MVLRKKRDSLGVFTKAKARLVVCANSAAKDIDADVFAPTPNEQSMKLLFAIGALSGRVGNLRSGYQRSIFILTVHMMFKLHWRLSMTVNSL